MDYLLPHIKEYFDTKRAGLASAELRAFDRVFPKFDRLPKTAHITGICGTATASLAKLLIDQGIIVTGSDQMCYPPMSTVLHDLGIAVLPFDTKNVLDKEVVIIGNVCPPNNIEAAYCREHKVPHLSMAEAVREYAIRDQQSIVIAGTHGKTTTTGMGIHVLEKLGSPPSYLVGGVNTQTGQSAQFRKDAKYFVIEGDEYDTAYFDKSPKFLHYKPMYTVVTSLELDHIDIYSDIKDYTNSFRFLIEMTNPKGFIFLCIDDEGVRNLYQEYKNDSRIVTYGAHEEATMQYKDLRVSDEGQQADIYFKGNKITTLSVPVFGEYNFQNAVAVFAVCYCAGFAPEKISEAFASFPGMKRRQEVVGEVLGVTVIDDFAHHPTAVRKTLAGIADRFPNRRIVALFEPRSNSSRSKIFETEYSTSFNEASLVVFSAPKAKEGYNPDAFMDIESVVHHLQEIGKEAYACSSADEIIALIVPKLKEGDAVVVMSNGSFDGIHQKLLKML